MSGAEAATAAGTGIPRGITPDWAGRLAQLLEDDRRDAWGRAAGVKSARAARRYAVWRERLTAGPGAIEASWEYEIARWPGTLFFHTGKPTILVAPQGHGKTNAICFLLERALRLRPDWDLYTNVPFPWDEELAGVVPSPDRLHAVRDATGLLRGIARTVLAGRVPAAALDESGQWLSSHDWRTDAAESMTKFTYLERHFRLRGPVLAYHTWKTVLEPFRSAGDLRGSYCRVVRARGMYRLARAEDLSAWWGIDEATLPFLTLGQGGFDWDLDFRELGTQLHGSLRTVAQQALDYLDRLEEQRKAEAEILAAEARVAHSAAIADLDLAVAEQHRARLDRREEIIRAFMERPDLPVRVAQARFESSPNYLVELKRIARDRLAGRTPPLSKPQGAP